LAEKKLPEQSSSEIDQIHIFEIDKAFFTYFNDKNPMKINGRKVPVLFGSWERFAQMQGNKDDENINSLRDKNGMLKLPIISINRESTEYNELRYHFIDNQGEPSIEFQKNIAESKFDDRRVPFTEKWKVGNYYKKTEPVYEIHKLPYPMFVNVNYTVTFWASYVKHANQFYHFMWQNRYPNNIEYNGYYFFTTMLDSAKEGNEDDYSQDERVIQYSYEFEVQAYFVDKEKIEINRTTSKILFEEKVYGLEELDAVPELVEIH
jgi:hypothetical protein